MARSRTLSELAADAYKLADLESFTDRYPLSEVYRYINQGISETWDLLVSARGYSYYGKPMYEMGAVTTADTGGMTVAITGVPYVGANPAFTLRILWHTNVSVASGTATFSFSTDGGSFTGPLDASVAATALPGTGLSVAFADGADAPLENAVFTSVAAKPVTVSGYQTYELPDDFYKLHQVWLSDTTRGWTPLAELQSIHEPSLQYSSSNGNGVPVAFQLRDGFIDLLPTPNAGYTINLNYVPSATVLIETTDRFDGINGWEDYCVGYAARKMLLKEGDIEMANMVTQDLNKMAGRITMMAAERSQGGPTYVQDVRGALAWKRVSDRRRFPRA